MLRSRKKVMRIANRAKDLPRSLKALSLGEEMGDYEFMADVIADLDEAGNLPEPGSHEAELLANYRGKTSKALEFQAQTGESLLKEDHPLNIVAAFLMDEIAKDEL